MGNELGTSHRQNIGLNVGGNIRAHHVLVNQGGHLTYLRSSSDTSPGTAFRTVSAACVFFKGRIEALSKINRTLTELAHMEAFHERILVIYGIPGIGKSELMRRFAEVYSSEYPNIGWINAESSATMGQDFQAVADMLSIEWNYNLEPKHNVRKVYEHVANHCGPNCLFIFDNVTNKRSEIRDFLPADQSITAPPLIVMTANQPIHEYKSLRLDELALSEAIDIFRSSQFLSLSEDQFSEVKNPLTELTTLIGCHPLGIVIAASYICDTAWINNLKTSIEYYIKQVRELSETFTEAEPEVPAGTQYKNNLKALWQLTTRRIQKGPHSNAMLSILLVLAYVDPENVTKAELEWLCLTDCPFKDETYWNAFHEDGQHVFDAALGRLTQLSMLIPITELSQGNNGYYLVHRLIQRFARLQDDHYLGFIRALYRSVDYGTFSIYPSCLERLNAIVKKRLTVDEELMQMCAVSTLKANLGVKLRFIEYLRQAEENSPETECLLVLLQIYANYRSEKQDPASAMKYIWSVVAIAKDWFGSEYGKYMIQHCAASIFRRMLKQSCGGLELVSMPEGYLGDIYTWVKGHIDLHIQQDGQDRKFFPKIIGDCMFKAYQVLEKVTHPREGLNSMEDIVNCLVYRAYRYCGNDDDLLDGYWHTMAVCLNIEGCKRLITDEMMEMIVNHATDTVRRATGKNRSVMELYCGFGDFMASILDLSGVTSKFLSCNSFMYEMSGHTKMIVLRGFSNGHILWLVIVGVAIWLDRQKVLKVLISPWSPLELPLLFTYTDQAVTYANTHVQRDYSNLISRYSSVFPFVLRYSEKLESELPVDPEGFLVKEVVKKLIPLMRKLAQSFCN